MKRLSLLLLLVLFSCTKDPVMYDITITATEGGTVSPQSGSYEEGSSVTITATPSAEYLFTGWSNGSTQNPLMLTITSDLNIQATFTKKQYELTISKEGEGTVSEKIINTGKGYDSGTKVELTAVPAGEWVFVGWSGDIASNDNPLQVTISSPKNIKAKFVKRKYPLTINIEGQGTVAEEIVNTGRTTDYDSGTTIKLTVQASEGWEFIGWNDLNNTFTSREVSIDGPKEVSAYFINKNVFSSTIKGNGSVLIDNVVLSSGTNPNIIGFDITPVPGSGYFFRGWGGLSEKFYGGVESTENETIFVDLTGDRMNKYEAYFDNNLGQVNTFFEIIEHPLNNNIREVFDALGDGNAAVYYTNTTGEYMLYTPNYHNPEYSDRSHAPRRNGVVLKKIDNQWKFFKIDQGITGWGYRNIKIIDNKYIITGDGNEIGDSYYWAGDIYFGEIDGENIHWTRVNNDSDMKYFHGVAAGDLNGDGLIDVGGTGGGGPGTKIFIQNPDGSFTNRSDLLDWTDENINRIGGSPFAWDFEDVTGDGLAEIIMGDYGSNGNMEAFNNISVWKFNQVSQKFELFFIKTVPRTTHNYKRGVTSFKVRDINNDGHKDILVNSEGEQEYITIEAWLGNGTGNFELSWFFPWKTTEMNNNEFFVMDANNDGFIDIIQIAAAGTKVIIDPGYPSSEKEYNFLILINDKSGGFSPYSDKILRDKYSTMGFGIPYMKENRLHFMGVQMPGHLIVNDKTMYLKTEDISFDLN